MTMTETHQEPTELAATAPEEAPVIGQEWLSRFERLVTARDIGSVGELMLETGSWRDFMAFTWDVSSHVGRDTVERDLGRLLPAADPRGFQLTAKQPPILSDGDVLVFFDFTTVHRTCRGYARLHRSEGGAWLASALLTQAEGFAEHPMATGHHRPQGKVHGYVPGRTRWTSDRELEADFADSEPRVVVLGAGHNGLSIAARLKALDVPSLVIERHERIGDNWRKRYAALALHSLLGVDHLPYYPFPETWTAHTPKDKFADHLESYAKALDMNVWTGTTFEEASYDDATHLWTIRVRRPDGSVRELHPAHFVVAAGLNGAPKVPHVEDLDLFAGTAVHSGEFQGGVEWAGKKVLVVGSAVSGHEIAHDLFEHGAEVTMLQRSATYVVNFDTFNDLWFGVYGEDSPLTPEFGDMVAYATPNVVNKAINQMLVEMAAEADKELLDQLQSRGFKLEWGPEGTGIIGSHMAGRDSYQINIGASELIADGRIGLKHGVEVARATPTGVVLTDGSEMDVDLVIFATGYEDMFTTIRPALGAAADKVQKVYGLAEDGEYSETWRRSRQPGLYFATGFVGMARYHSKPLTVLIKAIEAGLAPVDEADEDPH